MVVLGIPLEPVMRRDVDLQTLAGGVAAMAERARVGLFKQLVPAAQDVGLEVPLGGGGVEALGAVPPLVAQGHHHGGHGVIGVAPTEAVVRHFAAPAAASQAVHAAA